MKKILLLAALTLAVSAQAQVVTLDQAKAMAGNVTPGDTPGFPITISQPGSYRLMSNLVVGDVSVSAIRVTADGVTIDLNGFSVIGPRCGPSRCHIGTGSAGIAGLVNTAVANGYVTNFAGHGVTFIEKGTLKNVRSYKNGGCGAVVNSDGLIRDSAFTENMECGLWMGRSIARGNVIHDNQVRQVYSAGGAIYSGNRLFGVGAAIPSDQSVGDNICTQPGGSSQRC